jgi:hypothetical protein
MSETAGQSRLVVERWINTYLIPHTDGAGHPPLATAEDLPGRINRAVSEELASCCAAWLQGALDLASPTVWRIRELNLDLMVDMAVPAAHAVAHQWAERVALSVAQLIDRNGQNAQGTERDGVLCFENWGAYLAQFAVDLAAGRAWQMWYYEEFLSLKALSPSGAIAEAFTREPMRGAQAIVHLAAANRLDEILAVLSQRDTATIKRQCFSATGTVPSSQELSLWCGRILDLSRQSPKRLADSAQSDAHDALRWLAKVAVRFPGAERDAAAHAAVSGLLELRRVLSGLQAPLAVDRLVRNLVERKAGVGDTFQAAMSQGADSPEQAVLFLAQVGMSDPDWAVEAAAELLRDRLPTLATHVGESMLTGVGGVFLLGRALLEVNVEEIACAAAGSSRGAEEKAALLRYFSLVKCVHGARTPAAFSDPALRILSGCKSAMPGEDGEAFALEDLHRAAIILGRNLINSTGCEARCLLAELIPLSRHDCEALVLRDVARNVYLYACVWPSAVNEQEKVLSSALDFMRDLTRNLPWLLIGESLSIAIAPDLLQNKVRGPLVLAREEPGAEIIETLSSTGCIDASTSQDRIAQLLVPSTRELDAFSTDRIWPSIDIHLDLLCRLIARAVLRGFACNLKGFQANHPDYLRENFFEGVSTMRMEPDRIEIELPRSPLSLVLPISGLSRQRYTVPWLSGREIWLTPSQA